MDCDILQKQKTEKRDTEGEDEKKRKMEGERGRKKVETEGE